MRGGILLEMVEANKHMSLAQLTWGLSITLCYTITLASLMITNEIQEEG
jgi:hypothetical protein